MPHLAALLPMWPFPKFSPKEAPSKRLPDGSRRLPGGPGRHAPVEGGFQEEPSGFRFVARIDYGLIRLKSVST